MTSSEPVSEALYEQGEVVANNSLKTQACDPPRNSANLGAMIELRETATGVILSVRVAPRSRRNAIEGEHQGALKIRLTAPPLDDRANDSLRDLLAERLNVPVSAVRIVAGEKSRMKRVEIQGVRRTQVFALLNEG
jgi:uncharacterized protein